MIYDLHNDYLTGGDSPSPKYLSFSGAKDAVFVLWTSRLSIDEAFLNKTLLPFKEAKAPFSFKTAFEDLHFAAGKDLSLIGAAEPVYCGLTWNYDNKLAGGALGSGSLTTEGRRVIRYLDNRNIAIDTAHLNKRSFFEVLEYSNGRVLNSHCCMDEVRSHKRNLDRIQLKTLVSRGGIVGLTLCGEFLSETKPDIDDIIRHIDCFVSQFGIENLAIGTDFYGTEINCGLNTYSDFSLLKEALLKRGYTFGQIDKLFFVNAARFIDGAPEYSI